MAVLFTDRADPGRMLAERDPFYAVGAHYRDFHQVSDDEVLAALDLAAGPNTVPV